MTRTVPVPLTLLRDLIESTKRVMPRGQDDALHLAGIVGHAELLLHVPPEGARNP